jgi:hypothetical protein
MQECGKEDRTEQDHTPSQENEGRLLEKGWRHILHNDISISRD